MYATGSLLSYGNMEVNRTNLFPSLNVTRKRLPLYGELLHFKSLLYISVWYVHFVLLLTYITSTWHLPHKMEECGGGMYDVFAFLATFNLFFLFFLVSKSQYWLHFEQNTRMCWKESRWSEIILHEEWSTGWRSSRLRPVCFIITTGRLFIIRSRDHDISQIL